MKSQAATERIVTLSRQQVAPRGLVKFRGGWKWQYHIGNEMRGFWKLADAKKEARRRWPGCRIIERWKDPVSS